MLSPYALPQISSYKYMISNPSNTSSAMTSNKYLSLMYIFRHYQQVHEKLVIHAAFQGTKSFK